MKKFGLIGKSLGHSFSEKYFRDKFQKLGLDHHYENLSFETIDDIRLNLDAIKANYHGLNVTIPYKQSIIPLLDDLDVDAQKIGAVNCIAICEDRAIGHNTDYRGFIDAYRHLISDKTHKAYILGSGGASHAVKYALEHFFDVSVVIVSRSQGDLSYPVFRNTEIEPHALIINTTPLGMYPDTLSYPDIEYSALNTTHSCIDLIYNPETTLFMEKCRTQGAKVENGYAMLVAQAEYSWTIWNDID